MSLTYYLTIDGIVGDQVVEGHEGSFRISDYSFDVSAVVSAVSGGGGAGKTTFSPLVVDLDLNSGLTALLKDIATGQHIRSIELKGVSTDGHTVYDLKLGQVLLTGHRDTNSGHDILEFAYTTVSLTTTPLDANGDPGTPVTVKWNIETSNESGSTPDPVVPTGDPTGGGGADTYYLTIDGIVGDQVVEGHEGSFRISDYSFDVSAVVSAVSGGGGGAGKTTFSPLVVDLDLNSGLTALLKDIATGQHIRSIELKGVAADGHTVYDLKLGQVLLTGYRDTNSGHDILEFTYTTVSLTTTPLDANGDPGTPVTVKWNIETSNESGSTPDPVVPTGDPAGGGGADTYYLTIDGIVGDQVVEGHEGSFRISDYSFDVSAVVSAVSGGGGGAGKTTFSPLV